MKVGRLRWWWLQRRRLVMLPNGEQTTHPTPDRCVRAVFESPPVIVIEDRHDLRESRRMIEDATSRRAYRVRSWRRRVVFYRVDEPLAGRTGSGHWMTDPERPGRLTLVAVMLVPFGGFPLTAQPRNLRTCR